MLVRAIESSDAVRQSDAAYDRAAPASQSDESLDAARGIVNGIVLSLVLVWPIIVIVATNYFLW
jgi:hypothetical protein